MKIIISKTFNKKYLQKFDKYFSTTDFIERLKRNKINIPLQYPHFKIKLKIKLVDFRGVVLIQEGKYIIPLLLCLKKDKNCGENIIWEKYEKEILYLQDKALLDIKNEDYKIH